MLVERMHREYLSGKVMTHTSSYAEMRRTLGVLEPMVKMYEEEKASGGASRAAEFAIRVLAEQAALIMEFDKETSRDATESSAEAMENFENGMIKAIAKDAQRGQRWQAEARIPVKKHEVRGSSNAYANFGNRENETANFGRERDANFSRKKDANCGRETRAGSSRSEGWAAQSEEVPWTREEWEDCHNDMEQESEANVKTKYEEMKRDRQAQEEKAGLQHGERRARWSRDEWEQRVNATNAGKLDTANPTVRNKTHTKRVDGMNEQADADSKSRRTKRHRGKERKERCETNWVD